MNPWMRRQRVKPGAAALLPKNHSLRNLEANGLTAPHGLTFAKRKRIA
jgi:hypothetical protein